MQQIQKCPKSNSSWRRQLARLRFPYNYNSRVGVFLPPAERYWLLSEIDAFIDGSPAQL